MNIDTLEQEPCNTCGYEEGSIYCKEHCPHEAKVEQETVFFPPCQDCNTKMDEIRRAYDKLQEPSGDAISRKIISAFLFGLISDETERKKALEYINELPSVTPQEPKTDWIPVSERLPEDGERVLVTYDKIVIRATWDLMRFSFYDTHAAGLDKDFVYAWMPLPKPYEPQESEG